MPTLTLVRHGQARFGSADYDHLSPLGRQQCQALGAYWRDRGQSFSACLRGSLRRQCQSLEAIAAGHGGLPVAQEWPGLNEYDGDALVRAVHSGPVLDPHTPEGYREHFRLLRTGLKRWMAGEAAPEGMPSYRDWVGRITAVLDHVRAHHTGDVLLVSSGGPIASIVGQVLGTPPDSTLELNMRVRNSALTELSFSPRRFALLAFNHLPHLDHPDRRGWVTHS